jgi:hypothetical protein
VPKSNEALKLEGPAIVFSFSFSLDMVECCGCEEKMGRGGGGGGDGAGGTLLSPAWLRCIE